MAVRESVDKFAARARVVESVKLDVVDADHKNLTSAVRVGIIYAD